MAFELNVVLVRTLYPSNLGSAARAMSNMGGSRLILVDPKCQPDASKAKMAAAGAQEFLQSPTIYQNWTDFFAAEGGGFRIAMTRRAGRRRELNDLEDYLGQLRETNQLNQPVYLIFGPENNGLDADDLQLVNACAELPTYGNFGSLNLAQAVLLALYICQNYLNAANTKDAIAEQPENVRRPLYFPDQTIRDWIESIGFDIKARKASAYLTLKKLLLQNTPTDEELHVLESILQQNIRKLRLCKENDQQNN